jgi:hypothetical protein
MELLNLGGIKGEVNMDFEKITVNFVGTSIIVSFIVLIILYSCGGINAKQLLKESKNHKRIKYAIVKEAGHAAIQYEYYNKKGVLIFNEIYLFNDDMEYILDSKEFSKEFKDYALSNYNKVVSGE